MPFTLKAKAGPVESNQNMSGDRIVIPAFLQMEALAYDDKQTHRAIVEFFSPGAESGPIILDDDA